jgi:hypothetical protein
MPASQASSFIARGDVGPSLFVKQDVTNDHSIVVAGAGDEAIGVSHEGTREAPVTGITPLAAKAGESCMVYTDTFPCEVIAGGTIVRGDKLAPNALGQAVAAGAGQIYSAIARASAAAGEKVKATVQRGIVAGDGVLAAVQQALSGAGAINVTSYFTAWTTTAANAATLANGTFVGQRKRIQLVVDGGDGTVTPVSLAGGTTIVFSNVGDVAELRWNGTAWDVIERVNVASGAATTPVVA